MEYSYPTYDVDFTPEMLSVCRGAAQRLLDEIGLKVEHERFLDGVRGHEGVRVDGNRIHLSRALTDRYMDEYLEARRKELRAEIAEHKGKKETRKPEWKLSCGGFSISVIDIATDEVHAATCKDLSDLIRLVRSFGYGGNYPCTPQDVPPLMRTLACFKICWQEADNIRPHDYLDPRQTPFLFEMHKVMGKPFYIVINIPHIMTISAGDIDVFLQYYPHWKRNPQQIGFYGLADYPMLGVSKPITSTGAVACHMAHLFGTHIVFNLFDPEIHLPFGLSPGHPVDLQQMCWAYGSPRTHLYDYLSERLMPALCGVKVDYYQQTSVLMKSSSSAVDVRAGMEKMATTLIAAMQGARSFGGAGSLAVDDLFSGIQFVIDVEIFEYVKELIECFKPGPEIVTTDGLYEVLHDVATGKDEFYSHIDTAMRVRRLLPVSRRRPHEKLRSWMVHKQNMKDRVRDECLERIKHQEPFVLDKERYRELDKIYQAAERELVD